MEEDYLSKSFFAKCEKEYERENQLPPQQDKGSAVAGSTN